MTTSFAQYGPGREELPVNAARGILKRNAINDGWEEKSPEDILSDAAGPIDVNGQRVTNIGPPSSGTDAATVAYADGIGVNSVLFAAYKLFSSTQATGVSQPCSLADSLFTGYSPGGSLSGQGTAGVIAVSFANVGDETGTGAGQGGLGAAPAADQPYNTSDFPGQHVEVQLLRSDGAAASLSDLLSSPPPGQGSQQVIGYLSYRSDLGANLKWRMWFYYQRTSDGYHVSFTPDISIVVSLYVPVVDTLASLPVGFALGQISATPGAAGIVGGIVSDIQDVGTAAVAGSSGRFSDAQHVHNHGQQPAGSNGGLAHALADGANNGFLSAADFTKLGGLPSSAVPTTRTLTAGAGLTGGGDLSSNRGFDIGANPDGSIVVNADDVQVGVINDAQHGNLSGGALHAVATQSVAGFMAAADKAKLDNIAGSSFNAATETTNATPVDIPVFTPTDNTAVSIQATVTCRKSDGTAAAGFRMFGVFRRSGSVTTQVSTTKIIAADSDTGFNVSATFSVNGAIVNVNVTGLLATTIDWRIQGDIKAAP